MFFRLLLVCAVVSSNMFSVLGQYIYCDEAFQCVGQSVSDNYIQARGYKSASGDTTSMTANSQIAIYSGFGAYQIGSVLAGSTSATVFYVDGAFGGMEGDYNGNFYMFGSGAGSFANSDAIASTPDSLSSLQCSGSMACTEMIMNGTELLTCIASQDCQFMTMETLGTGQSLQVEAAGHYSLYGSIIICKSGDNCTFECYGAACFGAYIICESGSYCDIETLYPGNDDYYPLTDLNEPLPQIPEFDKNWDFDIITQGLNNDANCNLDIATTFDDYNDPPTVSITKSNGGNVCCRAFDACGSQGADDIRTIEMTNGGDIICDGNRGCGDITLDITQSKTSNVYCLGEASCQFATIEGNSSNNGYVYCGGYTSCVYGTINNVATVYVGGSFGALNTNINGVSNIYVTGTSGMFRAIVNSGGVGNMNLYIGSSLYSRNNYATINCESGDFCTIYCQTEGSCKYYRVNSICSNYQISCGGGANDTQWECPSVTDDVSNCTATDDPTPAPTDNPTSTPTKNPTTPAPTYDPTPAPTNPTLSPTLIPTMSPPLIRPCNNDPCDCDPSSYGFEDRFCHICHENTGCSQCESGYFKLNWNYPCQSCRNVLGDECLVCQDFNGCAQCKDGYEIYDDMINGEILKRCRKKIAPLPTPPPPPSPPSLPKPENTCSDGILKCESKNCATSGDNDYCVDQHSWGCSNCENGYFMKSFEYPCVSCQSLTGCSECSNWQGCIKCINGFTSYWDDNCGIHRCKL